MICTRREKLFHRVLELSAVGKSYFLPRPWGRRGLVSTSVRETASGTRQIPEIVWTEDHSRALRISRATEEISASRNGLELVRPIRPVRPLLVASNRV